MKTTVLLTLLVLLSSQIVLSTEILNVIVTLQTRLWQSEISDLLTSNTSCSLTKADFVWRSNPAATSIPTDFGIVTFPAKTAPYEKIKKCLLSQVRLVKSIEVDRSPYSGISSSHSKFTNSYDRTLNGCSRRNDGIEYVSRRGAVRGPMRGAYDINKNVNTAGGRSMLQTEGEKRRFIPASLAKGMNSDGYRGQGVNVAIFDSGLNVNHPHFKNVIERTNWTSDDSLEDTVGHGSFVAGVVAGTSPSCPGVAHESNLFIFRVFTSGHKSYTSWFLDAFNYALFLDIDIINFSVGGPDYADAPFTDKINELTASGIIVISAVGKYELLKMI
jgi:membrane-bound transcription factor site-1 protease